MCNDNIAFLSVRPWTEVFTAVGTVSATIVALGIAIKNANDLKREKFSGISIIDINKLAVATLENNAKIDVYVLIEKCLLTDGQNKKDSLTYLTTSNEKLRKEVKKIKDWKTISKYSLNSQEKVQFHFSDIVSENVYATFVALKIVIDDKKTRYYVLRFTGNKATESDVMLFAHPMKQWVIAFSFEE